MTIARDELTVEVGRPDRIVKLPDAVAALIAAGEVVERPAAVLKELLENSVDAGARRISIELTGAGRERIAVHDDGRGIPADELSVAFERHATSKLRQADELYRLHGYGFRGEALPAIAAAAGRLSFTSCTGDSLAAARISFRDGRCEGVQAAARAPGSSVELIDLFANQPARRAFLAGPRAERTALVRVAADLVLAHPELSLRLTIDGRELLNHQPSAPAGLESGDDESSLREALVSVFGSAAAQRAIFVESGDDDALRVDGYAGAPDDSRRNRDAIRLFVNGRGIHDRRLSYAIQDAYRDWLPSGRFPLAVVRVQVPANEVDVNVHPAKSEVKLLQADRAFSTIQRSLREALARNRAHVPVRLSSGLGGRRPDLEYADQSGPFAPFQASLERSPRSAVPTVSGRPAEPDLEPKPSLPPLRMVGQLHRTFIIAEGPNGLVLVDQHGAHERVVYERLLAARGDQRSTAQQPLLAPVVFRLDAVESAAWQDSAEALGDLGFEVELFAERALRIHSVPAALPSVTDAEQLLRGVLADLSADDRPPSRFDPVAASAACHGSVRRGAPMDPPSMSALLRDLERCRNPHLCPHGRPTLVEIAADDLWREFGRT